MRIKGLFVFLIFFFSSIVVIASTRNLTLSISSGFFFPKQKEFRDMYGNGTPLVLEAQALLWKNFGLSLGLEYLSMKGNALGDGEEYPLRFKMKTIPAAVFYGFPLKKIIFSIGFGGSYNSFQEKWETVEIDFKDNRWGYLVFSSMEYRLSSRFSFLARLRYDHLPTKKGSFLVKDVALGGLRLLMGFGIKLFP